MAKKNLPLAILTCMIAALACRSQGSEASQTPEVEPSQIPTSIQNFPTTESLPNPVATSPQLGCDSNNWKLIPTSVFTDPTPDEGWKYVLVRFAMENDSQYWGYARIDLRQAVITTEDGFQYSASDWEYSWVSNVEPFQDRVDSLLVDSGLLPPSFVSTGTPKTLGVGSGYSQAIFRVAASQNRFQLTIPQGSIQCVREGETVYDVFPSIILDLENEVTVPSYPATAAAFEELTALKEPLDLPNIGTLNFVGYETEYGVNGTLLNLHFQFTNASSGYDVNPNFAGYFIGNDGLARGTYYEYTDRCIPVTTVGPGLTIELDICTFIPDSLNNIALVITRPITAVFRLEIEPAPALDAQSPAPHGTWEGMVEERGQSYSVIMNLDNCSQGSQCGSISYPEISCSGLLTFLGIQDQQYVFSEKITEGQCIDGGTIRMHPQVEEKNWSWTWYDLYGSPSAFTILQKTK